MRHCLCLERTWLIGYGEGGSVGVGIGVFLPHDGVVDEQLHTGSAAIDVDTEGVAAMGIDIVAEIAHHIGGLVVLRPQLYG